jgi:hypothetical protein
MKMRLLVILAGLASSFTVPIFAQQKDTTDPQIAQQIRVLAAKYDEAFNNRDASSVAALYNEGRSLGDGSSRDVSRPEGNRKMLSKIRFRALAYAQYWQDCRYGNCRRK